MKRRRRTTERFGDVDIECIVPNGPNDIGDAILEAIGAKPGDTVEIVTPQFERPADDPAPTWTPETVEDYMSLRDMTDPELREIGLRQWGDEPEGSGNMVWLFPHEWYSHIPDGLPVVNIFGKEEAFCRGGTDDDKRFGCLSFGIMKRSARQDRVE